MNRTIAAGPGRANLSAPIRHSTDVHWTGWRTPAPSPHGQSGRLRAGQMRVRAGCARSRSPPHGRDAWRRHIQVPLPGGAYAGDMVVRLRRARARSGPGDAHRLRRSDSRSWRRPVANERSCEKTSPRPQPCGRSLPDHQLRISCARRRPRSGRCRPRRGSCRTGPRSGAWALRRGSPCDAAHGAEYAHSGSGRDRPPGRRR